ncbi:hypothetical protein SAMN05443247_08574 [Bradyrhizobium erythrophlei]|nr:hypothetical protein SAMN05443247_08574 [Bradyrhizobium erythrophlei]
MTTWLAEFPVPYSTDKPPGFLLEPFRWAIPRLIAIVRDQPGYLPDLIDLSHTRMHLIGVALAHLQTDPGTDLAEILFRGPAETLLEFSVGRQPPGLKRAVRIMPNYMMEAESYRALVRLLDEPQAARFFHHAPEIRDSTIRAMSDVPVELRAALFCLQENIVDMSSFSEGLRHIARRSGRLTFDGLVAELARARQPQQLVARLKSFVDTLPLPDALPPARVHHATRIDSGRQLRELGKKWGNCLESYVWNVEHGQCAIYLWRHGGFQAACSVTRSGRLGWFLDQIKGPENADVTPTEEETIQTAFRAAGILPESVIGSIAQIMALDGLPRRRGRHLARVRGLSVRDEITLPDPA